MAEAEFKGVARSGLIYGIGSVLSSAISFIFIPLFMNYFSVEEYGAYTLILFCSSIAGAIFYLGVTSALPRSYYDYTSAEERKSCFSTTLLILFAGALLQIVVALLFSNEISRLLFSSEQYTNALILGFLGSAITFINFSFLTYLRLESKALTFLFYSIASLLMTLGFVYFFVVVDDRGVAGALLGNLVAQSTLLCMFVCLLGSSTITYRVMMNEISLQLRFGFFVVLSSLAGMSILWVDQFFINEYLSLYEVGVYGLAVKLASVLTVLLIAPFVQVFNPYIMEHRESIDIEQIFIKSFRYLFGLGVLLIVVCSLVFQEVFFLIDKNAKYSSSLVYIPCLMFGLLFYGLNNIVGAGFFFERKTGKLVFPYFIVALFNIAANFVLIPYFGLWGAVASSLLTYLLSPILIYKSAKKYFSFSLEVMPNLYLVVSAFSIVLLQFFFMQHQEIVSRLLLKSVMILGFGYVFCRYYLKINIATIITRKFHIDSRSSASGRI